jgi:hypothetical protein
MSHGLADYPRLLNLGFGSSIRDCIVRLPCYVVMGVVLFDCFAPDLLLQSNVENANVSVSLK